jgi:uroporphyrinogen-III synthase
MTRPLEGRTAALAEGRQLEELALMLEKEGATTIRCPLISMLDSPDEAPVLAWLQSLIAGRFDTVILMTGEGCRRLLGFAERAGQRDAVVAALGKTRLLTRGPKPARALKEIGLSPTLVAEAPTTEGVIATLRKRAVTGTVGLQLAGVPNPALVNFLTSTGATVETVLPYVYAPAADAARVVALIDKMVAGEIDVILFTSSPQLDRLLEVAKEHGKEGSLAEGLKRTRIAAVGPVVADSLRQYGREPDICPEQGFVMKNLVQQIKRRLEVREGA